MYELAHCRPIVVISLLVLIAFYCINVYGNGYSAEHRLANPAPCLFQFTGKHVEISSGVFLIKKKNVTIRSRNIYVGRMKMLTLSRFQHFLKPCATSDMKIQNFLSRNHQKNRLSHINVARLCKNERDTIRSQKLVLSGASK